MDATHADGTHCPTATSTRDCPRHHRYADTEHTNAVAHRREVGDWLPGESEGTDPEIAERRDLYRP